MPPATSKRPLEELLPDDYPAKRLHSGANDLNLDPLSLELLDESILPSVDVLQDLNTRIHQRLQTFANIIENDSFLYGAKIPDIIRAVIEACEDTIHLTLLSESLENWDVLKELGDLVRRAFQERSYGRILRLSELFNCS